MSDELNDYLKEQLSHLTIALAPENTKMKLTKPFADGICMVVAYESTSMPDKENMDAIEEILKTTQPDIVFDIALQNTINLHPNVACLPMSELLESMITGNRPETHPYNGEHIKNVLSDITGDINGILNAIAIKYPDSPLASRIIAYPGMIKTLEECINVPFVISFLSMHEMLIQPYDDKETLSALLTIVKETTKNVDRNKDFLTDNVYEIKNGKLIPVELTKEETANG